MIDFNMLDLLASAHEPTSSGLLKFIGNAEDKISNTPFGVMRTGGGLPDNLVNAVKKFEGYEPQAKFDYKQYSSGYGTVARPGERIDRDEADRRLNAELSKAANYVDSVVPNLPEGVRNAMTSLTFNAGGSWAKAGLGQALRNGDYDTAKQLFMQYNKAGGEPNQGLMNRRAQEAQWFGGGGIGSDYAAENKTGRNMDNSGGIMGQLQSMLGGGGQQQRSSGIDPEIMSYLAMIGKGLSPYSELDPQAMLQSAQKNKLTSQQLAQQARQQAIDNLFRQQQLGLNERNVKISEQQANEPRLMQRPDGSIIMVPKNFSEGREGEAPAFKEVAPALKDPSLTEAGKYARDILGPQADPSTPEWKEKVTEYYKSKLKPELSPSDHRAIERAEDAMPGLENTLKNVQEAKDLLPNVLTGPLAKTAADLGAQFPSIASDKAKATRRLSDILQSSAIAEMSRTLKGSTTEREMDRFLRIGADVSIDPELRMKALNRVEELVQSELKLRQQRVDQMRGKTYYTPGGGRSGDSDTTKAAPADNAGALQSARDAIKRGAPREQVIKRLRDNGIDPSGL